MGFNGKPSKACLECRKRRLRCDLRRESCGQCRRANRNCTGYRDITQLRILDQTQSTKNKALVRKIRPHPTIPFHDIARNAFFYYYVSGVSHTYDALESLFKSPDTHLIASVDAVSLAFAASQFHLHETQQLAQRKYLTALPLLNQALRSPESAKKDSTLLAVILLDLFEKITNSNNDVTSTASSSWMSHVNGALSLVRLRTQDQLQSYIGLRLTARFCINMIISCVTAGVSVPSALTSFIQEQLIPHIQFNDPKWRVTAIVAKISNLRAEVPSLSPSEIHTRATDLDNELQHLAEEMESPSTYGLTRVAFSSMPNSPHPTPDHTQTWNVIRLWRIMLNSLILSTSSITNSAAVISTINTQALEILSTAAQITSPLPPPSSSPSSTTSLSSSSPSPSLIRFTSSPIPPQQTRQAYTLLFPLYVAGYHASEPSGIRKQVVMQLKTIAERFGIRKAQVLAGTFEGEEGGRVCIGPGGGGWAGTGVGSGGRSATVEGCCWKRGGEMDRGLPKPFEVYALLGGYGLAA